jgi:hypothetical protein
MGLDVYSLSATGVRSQAGRDVDRNHRRSAGIHSLHPFFALTFKGANSPNPKYGINAQVAVFGNGVRKNNSRFQGALPSCLCVGG